ncbi:YifB family Mg chelatase-like AAA ATPase [Synechococcus sp. PROS-U-1]|uniref:YifB family Mg chelatase-like AAA ATPase n=1 Tax=Synechococcus sp. PROS-U-1 TaxID=1400866 RepID=UPI001647AA48|nr:YifB family Mg chelatase-like AAA ATPase [Synechococcus sp. PROS-U-1]QNJ04315.1 putative ATP-dependent protease [Synechococcus sp. PROS-U-1]
MLARCLSPSLQGLEARPVVVEVDLAPGLPGVQLVGLPDKAIQESRERVRSALRNSGFRGPLVRVVINLAPADLRKEGPSFDLPIALALLVASGQLARPQLEGLWCAGELGLDGSLRPCRGVIALADQAHQQQARALVIPPANASEASLIEGLPIHTAPNLRELVRQLKGEQPWPVIGCSGSRASGRINSPEPLPSIETSLASRGLALSAAGGHHLLLVGPPGCGKTRLAHHLPHLLPPLSRKEALTITRIHSIAGHLHGIDQLQQQRPFRSPHHSCSAAALLGGGRSPRPGELSLAHGGVLFLDELAEFPRTVLDQLRQPLEEGAVQISRSQHSTVFPALITLVGATNPCPCGWHGDRDHGCRCSISQRQRYWQRLSGPLLDRLDLQLRLERRSAKEMANVLNPHGPSKVSESWCSPARIQRARQRMQSRNPAGCRNGRLSAKALRQSGAIETAALDLWEQLIQQRGLSTRSSLQLLRVARTIADLNDQSSVSRNAVAEASCYRCTDLLRGSEPQ